MPTLPWTDGRVELWYVALDKLTDPALWAEYRGLLTREEAAQEQRFKPLESRRQFLVSRVLVRTALSHYTGVDPRAWEFTPNAYGKPAVNSPAAQGLEFNLSHTQGRVVCACTWGHAIGVDVEASSRVTDHLAVAHSFFAPTEVVALAARPEAEQPGFFLELWTLKEAFIKAVGKGLSIPLDQFAISLAAGQPPQISCTALAGEDSAGWQLAQLRLGSRYRVGLALRLPAPAKLTVQLRESVPLRWLSESSLLPDDGVRRWAVD